MKAIPPKTQKARASPFGWILVAAVKMPPEMKGPTARPPADSVWARPLSLPSEACEGAEFVIYIIVSANTISSHELFLLITEQMPTLLLRPPF